MLHSFIALAAVLTKMMNSDLQVQFCRRMYIHSGHTDFFFRPIVEY